MSAAPSAAGANDPAILRLADLAADPPAHRKVDGPLLRLYSPAPWLYHGPWIAIDEGKAPGDSPAYAAVVSHAGLAVRLRTPGDCLDGCLEAWHLALLVRRVRTGGCIVIYDAESPAHLLARISRSLPRLHHSVALSAYGPRLSCIHAILRSEPQGHIIAPKAMSHAVTEGNGRADRAASGAPVEGQQLPQIDCPRPSWPLRIRGLHRRTPSASPGHTLRNWEKGSDSRPLRMRWIPRAPDAQRLARQIQGRRLWSAEEACKINLRYVAADLHAKGFRMRYWNTNHGVGAWAPGANLIHYAAEGACGFGCGSSRQ